MTSRDLVEIVQDAHGRLQAASNELHLAIQEVVWAEDDLQKSGGPQGVPEDVRSARSLASLCAEFAARTILPRHLDAMLERIQSALELIQTLRDLVPPIEPTAARAHDPRTDEPEVTSG